MQSIKKEDSNPSNASRTSLTLGTKPDYHPQQTEFIFDGLTIDSRFDSGNMANAARETDNHVISYFKILFENVNSTIYG